jgi:single-stranded DNA-binding protein
MKVKNKAELIGKIVAGFEYDHKSHGVVMYKTTVATERLSGHVDYVPVVISGELINLDQDYIGKYVHVTGQFRSFNLKEEGSEKSKVILYVFAKGFEVLDEEYNINIENVNNLELDCYICKISELRTTPEGKRKIIDIVVAVNYPDGRSYYIPSICWGKVAEFVSNLKVDGARARTKGRIQSRNYNKKISDTEIESRIAYEYSINKLEIL